MKSTEWHIKLLAGKLIAEGMNSKTYTKAVAKEKTKSVVSPVYIHRLIDKYTPQIKAEMKKIENIK